MTISRVLITGAGGVVGNHLVGALEAAGFETQRFQRRPPALIEGKDKPGRPRSESGEVFLGDIRDPLAVEKAINGVDCVFHLAAATSTRSLSASRVINVDGTRNVVEAASKQPHPPRMVFVSSLAAAGPARQVDRQGRHRAVQEEDTCHPVSVYGRTKLEAEELLYCYADRVPISIVRPPCVFGPGDMNLLQLYHSVRQGWNLVLSRDDVYSFLFVDDLIAGLTAIMSAGKFLDTATERPAFSVRQDHRGVYFLTDPEPVTFVTLADWIAQSLGGRRVRHQKIPHWLAWTVASANSIYSRVSGRKVFLNRDKVREGTSGSWICDASRAEKELGFDCPLSLRARIDETTQAYREAGRIR